MKFVFVSNYLNHHQIPFCNAMYELLRGDFAFVQTEPMEEERVKMGWSKDIQVPYLRLYYHEQEACRRLIADAKVVFFGGTDEEGYIRERLDLGKPVIRYSERLYKSGQWKAVSPRGLLKKYQDHTRYRRQPVYMLCAGAYAASDFHIVRAYPGKLLRWGYFPETREYAVDQLMAQKKQGSILWTGRFLDWKHPELAIETARYLRDKGYDFQMELAGGGELEPLVREKIEEYGLKERVRLLGYRRPEEIRRLMEQAQIYLMTSDRMEGWGAVVNEAMNSGCAVAAGHMAGAVPFLISPGKNGLIYRDGHKKELFAAVERLLQDKELCRRLGTNAIETITQEWNASTAARRLLGLCVRLGFLEKGEAAGEISLTPPLTGPCSPAPVLSERRMKWRKQWKNP